MILNFVRTATIVAVLVSCTSSVSSTYQYYYSPTSYSSVANTSYSTNVREAHPSNTPTSNTNKGATAIVTRSPKTATMLLCTPAGKLQLPPLSDYSRGKYTSHKDALSVLSNHLAELRASVRAYNNRLSQDCKSYSVLVN